MTDIKFDEKWLREAVAMEDEANCDIHAGLELGQNLGKYVKNAKSYINRQKLISILEEKYEEILTSQDIEEIANELQKEAQEKARKIIQAKKTA